MVSSYGQLPDHPGIWSVPGYLAPRVVLCIEGYKDLGSPVRTVYDPLTGERFGGVPVEQIEPISVPRRFKT